MLYALAPLALAAVAAAGPMPRATPADCQSTVPGTFEIQIVNKTATSKRMAFEKVCHLTTAHAASHFDTIKS